MLVTFPREQGGCWDLSKETRGMLGTIPRKQEGMLVIFLREQRGC